MVIFLQRTFTPLVNAQPDVHKALKRQWFYAVLQTAPLPGVMPQSRQNESNRNIWYEYQSRLAAFITSKVAEDATDDLLQDVFMRIHLRIDSLKDESKLESWLYQITRNAITDYYRTQRIFEELPEWLKQPQPEEEERIRKELPSCLQPMVRESPDKYRNAIQLSEIENKTQKEVAKQEGISLSGAKSRVQRGRALLKTMLDDCCQFEINHRNQLLSYEKKERDCKFC